MAHPLSKKPTRKELDRMAEFIRKGDGLQSSTARRLKVSRQTMRQWLSKYPELLEAFDDARESMLDVAESQLHLEIKKGKAWAVCFYLKCQGKSRGYVERQEVTGADGRPLEHAIKELPEAALRALAQGSNRGASETPAD